MEADRHAIRFFVEGTSPVKVVEVVHREVGSVLARCAPQLTAAVLVPSHLPEHLVNYSLLKKPRRMVVGGRVLDAEEVLRCFNIWIPPSGLLDKYHGFWSYRWTTEHSRGLGLHTLITCLVLNLSVCHRNLRVPFQHDT